MIYFFTFRFKTEYRYNWVRIDATSLEQAQTAMDLHYPELWSMCYDEYSFQSIYYPKGQLEHLNFLIDVTE